MTHRARIIISIAPVAPPCFPDRLAWLEFLQESDRAERRRDVLGPLDMRQPQPRFNFDFSFCGDCTAKHAREMGAKGRCDPEHLQKLAPKEKASA